MADFNFYLNRQGIRGPQGLKGEKGDDGKTPMPRTGTNTPIETTVIFDTGDGNSYETPNLKYPIEDRGGNVVMLDRTNNTQYYGTPDQATDSSYGIVKLATPESVLVDPLDNDVVTYELFDNNNQSIKAVTDSLAGGITQLNTDLGTEVTNRANADIQLTNKINTDVSNEAIARSNADTALSGRIDNLATSKADKSDVYTKTQTDSLLNNKSNVGHTHNYNDLTNKPTIPTVGNGTITLIQGGVTKGSFTTNQSGNSTIELDAGGGSQLTPGNAININNDVISVKYDGSTIGLNASGQLQSLIEEPDMTQYYTKSQVDNLIPDVSGFASSVDIGTMFTGATETKEDNVKLDVENSYQNITGGTQFVDNKYYLNWAYNMNTGIYAIPKTANETIPIMNVCVYKTTSVEDHNTKQTTTTTVPFMYVSDWLNSTGNRNVTAYTQDTYSFGTDTIQSYPVGTISEEGYQAIQDMQNAGLNLLYKDSEGKFQKVHSIQPSDVAGFYDMYLETIGYNFPLIDSTTGGINSYTFYMGWQQTAPTIAMYTRDTDNYSASGMIFVSINITKTGLDDMLNPTTGVVPTYEWENTRFAQYTDYASTQTAGLVKVGSNLSIATDGTLSADTQAPTAGSGISVNGTAVSVNVDNSTITINGSGELVANIPTPETVDQTYDATSTHAQSGVAIAGAGFLTSVPTATTSNLGLVQPDGTTVTINNGIISATGSTPSNMVTTDTQQIITSRKDMAIINIQPSGSTGYLNYITPISSGSIAISKSTSYDTGGNNSGIILGFNDSAYITTVAYGGNANYINMCTQYSNNTAEIRFCNGHKAGQAGNSHSGIGKYGDYTYIRNNNTNDKKVYKITTGGYSSSHFTNFLLESDMLDGTTISYDSTTGKISAGGNFVPTTRTINAKPLSSDITLTAGDVGVTGATDTTPGLVTKNHPMPGDISYIVTVGASGAEYTATDTGWFNLVFKATANNQYVSVEKNFDIDDNGIILPVVIWRCQSYGSTSNNMATLIPVKKGDTIKIEYDTGGTKDLKFIPSVS